LLQPIGNGTPSAHRSQVRLVSSSIISRHNVLMSRTRRRMESARHAGTVLPTVASDNEERHKSEIPEGARQAHTTIIVACGSPVPVLLLHEALRRRRNPRVGLPIGLACLWRVSCWVEHVMANALVRHNQVLSLALSLHT
jgi:hypothetical protein